MSNHASRLTKSKPGKSMKFCIKRSYKDGPPSRLTLGQNRENTAIVVVENNVSIYDCLFISVEACYHELQTSRERCRIERPRHGRNNRRVGEVRSIDKGSSSNCLRNYLQILIELKNLNVLDRNRHKLIVRYLILSADFCQARRFVDAWSSDVCINARQCEI